MQQTQVNGHILPAELLRLIAAGRWESLARDADLTVLPIEDKDQFGFLTIAQMVRNTADLCAAQAAGDGTLFALTDADPPPGGSLDAARAVVIAASYGQELLALDYARGEPPRIMALCYGAGRARWVEVAPTFLALLDLLTPQPT